MIEICALSRFDKLSASININVDYFYNFLIFAISNFLKNKNLLIFLWLKFWIIGKFENVGKKVFRR